MLPGTPEAAATARQIDTGSTGGSYLHQAPSLQGNESTPPPRASGAPTIMLCVNACYRLQGGKFQPCIVHGRVCEPIHADVAEKINKFAKSLKDSLSGERQHKLWSEEAMDWRESSEIIMGDILLWNHFVVVGAVEGSSKHFNPGVIPNAAEIAQDR